MTAPLVSVITVNLNRSEYLTRCFQSLKNQTYLNWEHIFVDGLSTDESVKLAISLSNEKFRFVSEKDAGIYDAFNKGVSLSKGDFICFLNTDDWYEPNFIEYAVETLISSNADWVFGDNFFHNLDGTLQFIPGDPLYFYESWKTFSRFHHTTVLVRRTCFDEIGLFPLVVKSKKGTEQKIRICNDYYWFLKLQLAGKMGIYDHRITGHMEYGGISTTRHSEAAREAFLIAKKVFGNNRKIKSAWRKRKRKNQIRHFFGFLYRKAPIALRRKIRMVLGAKLSSFIYEKLIA